MALIGLDIGGTKFLVARADHAGNISRLTQAQTPLDLQQGLRLLEAMVCEVADGDAIDAVGASCGGPLDPKSGIVSPLHQANWRNVPLKAFFEQRFHCPFQVEVDTDAAVLAEYRFGPEQPDRLLYLTLSTGMGGGFLIDGKIFRGARGAHPEAGHQVVPYRLGNGVAALCECGASGCLEALVSGTGIRKLYGKPAEQLTEGEWDEVGFNLGQGLRNLAVLYAPDTIVLGGGLAIGGGTHFIAKAEAEMRAGLRLVRPPRVRVSALGYHTSLLGSLALAQDCYCRRTSDPIS